MLWWSEFYQSNHLFQICDVRCTSSFSVNDCIKKLESSKIICTINHSLWNSFIDFLWSSITRIHWNSFVIRYNSCSWSFLTKIIHCFNKLSQNRSNKIVRENFFNEVSKQLYCFYKSLIRFFDVKLQLMTANKNLNFQNCQNAVIHMILFISVWKFIFYEFNRADSDLRTMQLIRDE